MKKEKIVEAGQLCRHCQTPVVKRMTTEKPRNGRAYYYEYYFRCPNVKCGAFYMPEEGKRFWPESPTTIAHPPQK